MGKIMSGREAPVQRSAAIRRCYRVPTLIKGPSLSAIAAMPVGLSGAVD
jgi:hypothetical protein